MMKYGKNSFPLIHKKANSIASILLIAILLASCVTSRPSTPTELVFYNWKEYMPQSVLDSFSAEYGIKVTYLTYGSMEEAVAQIRAGQTFDVVVMENSNIKPLADEGLLATIDFQNVPNFKNISSNFRDLTFDPGNLHSIPLDYGTTALLVRSDLIGMEITHWNDLWNPHLGGKIAARPMAYELIGISLLSLGYSLNSENPQELEAALQRLIELKPSLILIDDTTDKAVEVLLRGEAAIMIGWGNDALKAEQENGDVRFTLPEEGAILWGQSFVIPANSQHKEAAELFLNFLLRPEISVEIINYNHYAIANEAAYSLLAPEIFNNPIVFPPAEVILKSDWYQPLTANGKRLYDDIWQRFLNAQ